MNKRSLIQLAVVGMALGAALVSAFPTLVEALRLASAQAALPADNPQDSNRSSFVFPGDDSESDGTSSEASHPNRANSASASQPSPYVADDRFAHRSTSTQSQVRFGNQAESGPLPAKPARDDRSVRFVFPVPRDSSGDAETSTAIANPDRGEGTMEPETGQTPPAQASPYSTTPSANRDNRIALERETQAPVRLIFPATQNRSERPVKTTGEFESATESTFADGNQRRTEMEEGPDGTTQAQSPPAVTEKSAAPTFGDDGFDLGSPMRFDFPDAENQASDSKSGATDRETDQPSDSPAVDHSSTAMGQKSRMPTSVAAQTIEGAESDSTAAAVDAAESPVSLPNVDPSTAAMNRGPVETPPNPHGGFSSETPEGTEGAQPAVRYWHKPSWLAMLVPQRQSDGSSTGSTTDDHPANDAFRTNDRGAATAAANAFQHAPGSQGEDYSDYLTDAASPEAATPQRGPGSTSGFANGIDSSHATTSPAAGQTGTASGAGVDSVRQASADAPYGNSSSVRPASAALPDSRAELSVLPAVEPDEEPASLNAALVTSFSQVSSVNGENTVAAGYQSLATRRYRSENRSSGESLPALTPQQNQGPNWPVDKPLPPSLGGQHPSGTTPGMRNHGRVTSRTHSNKNDQIHFPWEKDDSQRHVTPYMAQAQPDSPNGDTVTPDPTSQPETPAAEPLPLAPGAEDDTQQGGDANNEDEQTLGEEPEDTDNELQFLRNQSILLEPGDYQCEVGIQYLYNESDFTFVGLQGNLLNIAEARRRQRLVLVPIELRVGLTPVTQLTVDVPFGWSNAAFLFNGEDDYDNEAGIGDVSMGITRMLIRGTECFPDVLAIVGFSAPTGQSNFATSLAVPGSNLGQGFWTATAGLTCIQTIDPIVFFYGMGYQHRFENSFDNGITVNPGKQIYYQFGAGFAINPRVTMSATFFGSFLTEDYVNGRRLAGSIREPMSIRLASTVGRAKKQGRWRRPVKFVEPFCTFGITEDANDVIFGVSWTR